MNIYRRFSGILAVVSLALSMVGDARSEPAAKPSAEVVRFFENKVRPVLAEQCFRCHGADKQKGKLRLDSRAAALAGGERGPAFVPGDPDKSLLLQAVRQQGALVMPPGRKLRAEQIADLTQWIRLGAPWPAGDAAVPAIRRGEFQLTARDREHWAFQPVRRPAIPVVKGRAWSANPIDAFIRASLEAKGLQPNPPAGKRELIRRLTYDLTGLPPTPEEVEAFVADSSPLAYEKLVDRLLASPHYGEKWARHWLDLVRFAETNSYERDGDKPNAWRFRDYVIRAFNDDKPADRFILEQLAGDELPDGGSEALIATGYYRLGIWDDEPTDREQARYDALDDIVATTGQTFLGLTFDCARCHDHKIDPVPQKDYYRLVSFFHNISPFRNGGPTDEVPLFANNVERQQYAQRLRARKQKREEVQAEVTALENEFLTLAPRRAGADNDLAKWMASDGLRVLGKERFERFQHLQRELETLKKPPPADMALCVTEPGTQSPETFVLRRGNPQMKGDRVGPAFPVVFNVPTPTIPNPPAGAKTSGRRLVLARWIASADNPLTARVLVNRVWQHHFGRGIVRSASNFGLQGDRPTHPELLDWLAAEFVKNGWRLKPLHRRIVTSQAYRMSSRGNAAALAADPANDLFWRFDSRRLTAEELRDSLLAVTGTLNSKMGGPGIYVDIPKEVHAGQSKPGLGWGKSSPEEQARCSIYIHAKRSLVIPILETFDLAETDRSTPVRFTTTQPSQALAMLNSSLLHEQAGRLAGRLRQECGTDVEKQVRRALYLATQRPAEASEVRRGIELIEAYRAAGGTASERALEYFCLLALNLNEFVYVD
jgi:cytochrome c553